jgi:superoxide dismutase, Fe-Mn family
MESKMTADLDRRSFVHTGAAMTAGAVTAAILPSPATAQTASPAASGTKPITFNIKPLPFDPSKVKGLSEKILISHHDSNYTGAIKRLNVIEEQHAGLDYAKAPGFLINGLKREELIAANSMILHELYFAGLSDGSQPGAALADALGRDFGNIDRWRAEFVAMGKAEGGGSAESRSEIGPPDSISL